MTQPPSFTPQNPRRRPSAQGAKVTGERTSYPPVSAPSSQTSPPSVPGSQSVPGGQTGVPTRSPLQGRPARANQASPAGRTTAPANPADLLEIEVEIDPPAFAPRQVPANPPAFRPAAGRTTAYVAGAHESYRQSGTYQGSHAAFAPAGAPATASPTGPATPRGRRRAKALSARRVFAYLCLTLLVVALLVAGWGWYLVQRVEGQIGRVDALTTMTGGEGATYLLAGSDARGNGVAQDGTEGQRSDTIMLVHRAENGQSAIVSLPRDTYVEIPGYGPNKLNAAYSFGGEKLLVTTVEQLTGRKVDHFVEVGMGGVASIVDAVGGINLCYDRDVADRLSGMNWQAGCHDVDGTQALAFSRMRYSDPQGDIGRGTRQRQVVSQTLRRALSWEILISPAKQLQLADAGAAALRVDQGMGAFDVLQLARTLKAASAAGLTGAPPIESLNYRPGKVGSTVKLDEAALGGFWDKLFAGQLAPTDFQSPM